jgi:hypothetical protein
MIKKRNLLGGSIVGLVGVAAAVAGCLSGEPAPVELDSPENVQILHSGLTTTHGDSLYLTDCRNNHVPSPPPWGPNSLGKWTDVGTFSGGNSLNGQGSGHIYLWISGGMCILMTRSNGGGSGGSIDIICQSETYGTACFYEGGYSSFPSTQSFPNSVVKGGVDLGNQCTTCHAGENVFLAHNGTLDALDLNGSSGWMPAVWANPIVSGSWVQNPGPETFAGYPPANPWSGTPGDVRPCTWCHYQGGPAGRFPKLRTPAFGNPSSYCAILRNVTSRPGSQGGMPPLNTCNPALGNCAADKDPFTRAMLANCGQP